LGFCGFRFTPQIKRRLLNDKKNENSDQISPNPIPAAAVSAFSTILQARWL
jgi:hypothetical protein